MSLKELRKKATEGPRSQCPACGKNVPVSELMSGRHAANDCAPFKQAIKDAEVPKFQRELVKEHSQAKLVMKRQTMSERNFERLGQSDFVRTYWIPSVGALTLLAFAIGWASPQGTGTLGLILNIAIAPTVFLGGTFLLLRVNGRIPWLHNPFKRRKPDGNSHA